MKRFCWLLAGLYCFAEAAYGLASMQAFYSYRLQKEGEQDSSAHMATLAGHLSPLPLIPVGLGVSYSPWVSYEVQDGEDSATGMELGVELLGWLPMVPFVTPYAKINYTVWGHKKTTYEDSVQPEKEEKVKGMGAAVGIGYDLLPLLTLMAEVSQGFRSIEDQDFNSTAFSIGVEVGI